MELALAVFNVGAGLGILAVGLALVYLAWRVTPLIRETRLLTDEIRQLSELARTRLPRWLERSDELMRGADVVAGDAALQVSRLRDAVDALERADVAMAMASAPHRGEAAS